jgi:hypothetical protein
MEADNYLDLIRWVAEARARSAAAREASAKLIAESRQLAAVTNCLRDDYWHQRQARGGWVEGERG